MKIDLKGDWEFAEKVMKKAPKAFAKAVKMAVRAQALESEYMVKQNIRRGPYPPLSPLTRRGNRVRKAGGGAKRKSGKPLNATGGLLGAVTVVPEGLAGEYFIGIPRTAGRYNLAVVHEFGRTIVLNMTPKMRKFLFGVLFTGKRNKGAALGKGYITIRIPARPFIEPAFDVAVALGEKHFKDRLRRMFAKILG